MILIRNNSQDTEFVLPITPEDSLNFEFAHHLSGNQVSLTLNNTSGNTTFFKSSLNSNQFLYEGLYSFIVLSGDDQVYSGLMKIEKDLEAIYYKNNNEKNAIIYK